MVTTSLGWQYEGPDQSVGIFGYSVWHEECEQWCDGYGTPTETLIGFTYTPGHGYVEITSRTRLMCPFCREYGDMYETHISSYNYDEEV